MTDDVIRSMLRRIGKLEREVVRYRQGVVSDTDPLAVKLGGGDVALAAASPRPRVLAGPVDALTWAGDLLVLPGADEFLRLATAGDVRLAFGQSNIVFTAASVSATATVTHGLKDAAGADLTPALVVASSNWATDSSVVANAYSPGATTFSLRGFFAGGGPTTGTVPVSWIAIG